jgi:uncharacterized protein (TIGR02285 family)
MRRAFFPGAALAALLAVSSPTSADPLPKITWILSAFPPATITPPSNAGQGYADRAMAFIVAQTPEFEHVIERVNLARFQLLAESRDGVCNPALLLTPDRELILHFSDPAYQTLGNRLITTQMNANRLRPLLKAAGVLRLSDLETIPDFIIGHGRTRVFGPEIDEFLTRMDERRLTYDVASTSTAIRMLSMDRIDYTFASPVEAGFYLTQDDQAAGTMLTSFAIEGVETLQNGRFACSKGPVGQKLIQRINALIPTDGFRQSWRPAYEGWLDKNALQDFNKAQLSR